MTMQLAIKILVLGGRKVGKSAVSVRFLTRRYIGEYSSDKDHIYKHNTITTDGSKRTLELLDVSGDWCLKPPIELQGQIQWASAIVLVYDVTDRHSFNSINKLISVVSSCRSNFLPVALVGNKQDLEFGRQVETSEGRNLATKYNFYFFEVSAAESTLGIRAVFDKLITHVINARENCAREMTLTRSESSSGSSNGNEVATGDCSTSHSSQNIAPTGPKKSLTSHFTIFGSVLGPNRKNSMSSIKYI